MTPKRVPADADCVVPWTSGSTEADHLLRLLGEGELTLQGMMPWSSNYTFLGRVSDGDTTQEVIYKPVRGERPLWDFPKGTLAKREVAAFVVCHTLGWDFVPPTVLRSGPHGRGSVQLYVDVDADDHFFTFRDDPQFQHSLQALALFDIITNNADRKGGHCLRTSEGCIIAIDQGLCFHAEPKLRTVIWDFAGQPMPTDLLFPVARLADDLDDTDGELHQTLRALLFDGEIAALRRRAHELVLAECFPDPPEDRRPYPWPLV